MNLWRSMKKLGKKIKFPVFSAKSVFCQNSPYMAIIHHICLRYMVWEPTEPFWAQLFFNFFPNSRFLEIPFSRDLEIQKLSLKSEIHRKLNTGGLRAWSCASNASSKTKNVFTTTEKKIQFCVTSKIQTISTQNKVDFWSKIVNKNAQKITQHELFAFSWNVKPLSLSFLRSELLKRA